MTHGWLGGFVWGVTVAMLVLVPLYMRDHNRWRRWRYATEAALDYAIGTASSAEQWVAVRHAQWRDLLAAVRKGELPREAPRTGRNG